MALSVAAYIGLRFLRPEFRLAFATAERIVWPVALVSGVLQGAAGISAPVSVSYLNAMRLARPVFIATISACFIAMAAVQVPMLFATGLLSWPLLAVSVLALQGGIGCTVPLPEVRAIGRVQRDHAAVGLAADMRGTAGHGDLVGGHGHEKPPVVVTD